MNTPFAPNSSGDDTRLGCSDMLPALFLTVLCLLAPCFGHARQLVPVVTVVPVTAEPGTPRTITVTGTWPTPCPPVSATVLPPVSGINAINVRLIEATFDPTCPSAPPRNYTLSVTYIPTGAAVQPILVSLASSALIGEGTLVTSATGQIRSAFDLSGAWSDVATIGSGLAISHSHAGSDLLAGSLYVYNPTGFPTWLLIQNSRWISPVKARADLVLYRSNSANCPINSIFSNTGCPKPSIDRMTYGIVDIELLANGQLQLNASTQPTVFEFSFTPLFSATMSRLQF